MNNRKLHIFILLMVSLIAFFVNNGAIEANIMEARNLTTAREMLQNNSWLEPTMNGNLRFEKPPLPTWITAVTMYFTGQENLSLLRLPAALAALLMVFFLFKLTEELTDDKLLPFLVSGTAGTSFYIFFMARDVSWDIFCHSFMIGAIWLIHKGLKSNENGWPEFAGAGVLMGLSFLSKGPVSFYALLLPYFIARSFTFGWKEAKNMKFALTVMVLITLAISLWWPILIWSLHPDYLNQITIQESAAWLNRNTRPFYHYWSFPIQSGIWTITATVALIIPYTKSRISRFGNYTFLFLWVISSVVLLSFFPEKKERYLLPVLLPLAFLTAFYFRYLIEAIRESSPKRADVVIFNSNALLMAIICFLAPLIMLFLPFGKGFPDSAISLILVFILFWGLAVLFVLALRRKNALWLWMGMVGVVLSVCIVLLPLLPKFTISNSGYRSYKELRYRDDLKEVPFYFNGEIEGKFIEVIWQSGHRVKGWNPLAEKHLPVNIPLIFLSNKHPSTLLSTEILNKYQIDVIGYFDGNMNSRGGNIVLSNYVTLIR